MIKAHFQVDLDDTASMKKRLSAVKTEKNVTFTDMFTVSESMLDFDDKMEQFYEPQVQKEDVISMVVEGTCYYDVEPEDDSWIRVQLEKGDLIVIPKGLSYRFTTTPQVGYGFRVNFGIQTPILNPLISRTSSRSSASSAAKPKEPKDKLATFPASRVCPRPPLVLPSQTRSTNSHALSGFYCFRTSSTYSFFGNNHNQSYTFGTLYLTNIVFVCVLFIFHLLLSNFIFIM